MSVDFAPGHVPQVRVDTDVVLQVKPIAHTLVDQVASLQLLGDAVVPLHIQRDPVLHVLRVSSCAQIGCRVWALRIRFRLSALWEEVFIDAIR